MEQLKRDSNNNRNTHKTRDPHHMLHTPNTNDKILSERGRRRKEEGRRKEERKPLCRKSRRFLKRF